MGKDFTMNTRRHYRRARGVAFDTVCIAGIIYGAILLYSVFGEWR